MAATRQQIQHYLRLAREVEAIDQAAHVDVTEAIADIFDRAAHVTMTGTGVAVGDFRPAPITDSVPFNDPWGDAR